MSSAEAEEIGREYHRERVAELAHEVRRHNATERLPRYVELRFHPLYAGGAWGREARAVVALAERLGVAITAEQLMFDDVRDLQALRRALGAPRSRPHGWLRRLWGHIYAVIMRRRTRRANPPPRPQDEGVRREQWSNERLPRQPSRPITRVRPRRRVI